MMKQKFFWMSLLVQIFFALYGYSQDIIRCGSFSSEALEKWGLGCEYRPTYTTQEYTIQTTHFIIHYTLGEPPPENYDPPDDGTTHGYAQTVSEAAEAAWGYQIDYLDWQIPPYDGDCGGSNNKYDIYIKMLPGYYNFGLTTGETPMEHMVI